MADEPEDEPIVTPMDFGPPVAIRNAYHLAILDAAPDAYWRMNNPQPPPRDTMGMHHLTVVGNPTFLMPGAVADGQARSIGDFYPVTMFLQASIPSAVRMFAPTAIPQSITITGPTLGAIMAVFPPNEPAPAFITMDHIFSHAIPIPPIRIQPDAVLLGTGALPSKTVLYAPPSLTAPRNPVNCDVLIVGGGGNGAAGWTTGRGWDFECEPHDVHLAGGGGGGGQVITANVNFLGSYPVTVGAREQASSVYAVGTANPGGRGLMGVDNGPGVNDKGSRGGGPSGSGQPGGGGLYGGAGGGGGQGGGGGGAYDAQITCEMPNSQYQRDNSGRGGAGANGIVVDYSGAGAWYGSGGGGGGCQSGGAAGAWAGAGGAQGNGGGNAGYYGNGGGGGGAGQSVFGYGYQGIVIIRYAGAQVCSGGAVSSSGGYTIHTFTSSGSFNTPGNFTLRQADAPMVEPVFAATAAPRIAPMPAIAVVSGLPSLALRPDPTKRAEPTEVTEVTEVVDTPVIDPRHGTVWLTSGIHAGPWGQWQNPKAFSLSGWFIRTNLGISSGFEAIVARVSNNAWSDGFGVFWSNNTLYGFVNRWDGDQPSGAARVAITVQDWQWYHFNLQYRPKQHGFDGEMEFWLDGVRIGGGTVTGGIRYSNADNRFIFGNDLAEPVKPFLGRLGDIAFFHRWMNQWEIVDLYRSAPIPANQRA